MLIGEPIEGLRVPLPQVRIAGLVAEDVIEVEVQVHVWISKQASV
jgi:hypothetical protein